MAVIPQTLRPMLTNSPQANATLLPEVDVSLALCTNSLVYNGSRNSVAIALVTGNLYPLLPATAIAAPDTWSGFTVSTLNGFIDYQVPFKISDGCTHLLAVSRIITKQRIPIAVRLVASQHPDDTMTTVYSQASVATIPREPVWHEPFRGNRSNPWWSLTSYHDITLGTLPASRIVMVALQVSTPQQDLGFVTIPGYSHAYIESLVISETSSEAVI